MIRLFARCAAPMRADPTGGPIRTADVIISADVAQVLSKGQRMRNGAFVFAALLFASCGSHTTSLDDARNQFLEARADYQACMNSATGEGMTNCEPKRLIVED